jgi:hypothetical protein
VNRRVARDGGFAAAPGRFAANVIGHPADGDLREPCAGIVRQTVPSPAARRGSRRFLDRILRCREVAISADHRAKHLRRPDVCRGLGHKSSFGTSLRTYRTSIGMFPGFRPGPGAADARAAILYASSALSTSTIQ